MLSVSPPEAARKGAGSSITQQEVGLVLLPSRHKPVRWLSAITSQQKTHPYKCRLSALPRCGVEKQVVKSVIHTHSAGLVPLPGHRGCERRHWRRLHWSVATSVHRAAVQGNRVAK